MSLSAPCPAGPERPCSKCLFLGALPHDSSTSATPAGLEVAPVLSEEQVFPEEPLICSSAKVGEGHAARAPLSLLQAIKINKPWALCWPD